jgi:WD40 repeat protein
MDTDYQKFTDFEESNDLEKDVEKLFNNTTSILSNIVGVSLSNPGNEFRILCACEDGKVYVIKNTVQSFEAHKAFMTRILEIPSGEYFVTSSNDRTVKVWHSSNNALYKVYEFESEVISIDVTNTLIFAGLLNGGVSIINFVNDQITKLSDSHSASVVSVNLASNGEFFVTASSDTNIKIWSKSGALIQTLKGHTAQVNRVVLTNNSLYAISASNDTTVRLWNLELYDHHAFEGHTDQVWALAVTPDDQYALSGSKDFTIRLWNLLEKTLDFVFEGHTNLIVDIAVSKNSKLFVSGSFDKLIKVWDLEKKQLQATYEGHTHYLRSVKITDDNKYLYSAGADKTIRKWALEAFTTYKVLKGHTDWLRRLAITSDGKYIVSSANDKTVRLWNRAGELLHTFVGHKAEIWGLNVTPDGLYAISGSHDKNVILWNLKTRTLEHVFEGHTGWIFWVYVTPDSRYALTPSYDATIGVWDIRNKTNYTYLKGHTDAVNRMCLSRDGKYAFSAAKDNTVKMWNIEGKSLLASFNESRNNLLSLTTSPDQRYCISGSNDKSIRFYDIETKTLLGTVSDAHEGDINRIVVTPDSSTAISCSDDKTIKIWNIATRTLLSVFEGHLGIVTWIDLTPDGNYLASVSRDLTVKVWNLKKKILECSFNQHTGVIYNVAITPEGTHVVSTSFDNTLIINTLFPIEKAQKTLRGVYNVSLEAMHRAIYYKTIPYNPDLKDALIFPLHINLLHLYSYTDKVQDLSRALSDNVSYFTSSRYGTPLGLAIKRNNFECVSAIIKYFISVSEEKPVNYQVFSTLIEDLYPLLRLRLPTIASLFENLPLIGGRSDLKKYIGSSTNLPEINFSNMHQFKDSLFNFKTDSELIQINYFAVPFRLNIEPGSFDSLLLLEKLFQSPNKNIFVSRLVVGIIDYKWKLLLPAFILEFAIYLTFVLLMCIFVPVNGSVYGLYSILFLNTICLLLEFLQFFPNVKTYFSSFWNWLDILRISLCYTLIIRMISGSAEDEVSLIILKITVMLLTWIKGIGYFRMFKQTRHFVTMLVDVAKDSLGFGTIFFYSIIAFTNIYQILVGQPNFFSAFKNTYGGVFGADTEDTDTSTEISDIQKTVGWFIFFISTLVITVVMLNLLISVFSDTYDRVQLESSETSNYEKITMIYDIEKMLFWKRYHGVQKYMVICDRTDGENAEWSGKIKAIIESTEKIEESQNTNFEKINKTSREYNEQLLKSLQDLASKIEINEKNLNAKIDGIQKKLEAA